MNVLLQTTIVKKSLNWQICHINCTLCQHNTTNISPRSIHEAKTRVTVTSDLDCVVGSEDIKSTTTKLAVECWVLAMKAGSRSTNRTWSSHTTFRQWQVQHNTTQHLPTGSDPHVMRFQCRWRPHWCRLWLKPRPVRSGSDPALPSGSSWWSAGGTTTNKFGNK